MTRRTQKHSLIFPRKCNRYMRDGVLNVTARAPSSFPLHLSLFVWSSFIDHTLLESSVGYKDVHDMFNSSYCHKLYWVLKMSFSLCEEVLTCGNGPGQALIPRAWEGKWVINKGEDRQTNNYQTCCMHQLKGTNEKFGWHDSKGSFQQWLYHDSLLSGHVLACDFLWNISCYY